MGNSTLANYIEKLVTIDKRKENDSDKHRIYIANQDTFWRTFNDIFLDISDNQKENDADKRWIFKGTKPKIYAKDTLLKTELENCFSTGSIKSDERIDFEKNIIRKFKRQGQHHYIFVPPVRDGVEDIGYLLSLMRHYGAPVRLMDWSYSFFVATYFALNRPKNYESGEEYVVWAINDNWLSNIVCKKILFPNKKLQSFFAKEEDIFTFKNPEFFSKVYFNFREPIAFVHNYNPIHLNERLVAQQGLFLCPGDITKSFEVKLVAVFEKEDPNTVSKNFKQIIFSPNSKLKKEESIKLRKDILKILLRMNINQAILFPGLQGFSEGLSLYADFPEALKSEGSQLIDLYKKYLEES